MAQEELIHKIVDEISFGLISPKDLRKQSVVEIQTPDTYDEDGAPITAGLMDGRLGTLEPRQRCKTCGNTAIRCPGTLATSNLQYQSYILNSPRLFLTS